MLQNESVESLVQELLEESYEKEDLSESEIGALFKSSRLRNELPNKERKLYGYKPVKYVFEGLFEKRTSYDSRETVLY